jgi:hypothetical protein
MEDAYRTHKGIAEFGWVALVKELVRGLKRRRAKGRGPSLEAWGGALSLPHLSSGPPARK